MREALSLEEGTKLKKNVSPFLYIVVVISTIFFSIRITKIYDLNGPFFLVYVIATGIIGYWLVKMGIEIICEYKKNKKK